MAAEDQEGQGSGGSTGGERPLSDSLLDAVEGAFAATGLTRDRAQELSDRTRDRAQDLVGEVSRVSQEAREALEGLKVAGRDEFDALAERVERLERRLDDFVNRSGEDADGD
jgi:uncharacterized protein Yka (UPF0111/DUF47 family)